MSWWYFHLSFVSLVLQCELRCVQAPLHPRIKAPEKQRQYCSAATWRALKSNAPQHWKGIFFNKHIHGWVGRAAQRRLFSCRKYLDGAAWAFVGRRHCKAIVSKGLQIKSRRGLSWVSLYDDETFNLHGKLELGLSDRVRAGQFFSACGSQGVDHLRESSHVCRSQTQRRQKNTHVCPILNHTGGVHAVAHNNNTSSPLHVSFCYFVLFLNAAHVSRNISKSGDSIVFIVNKSREKTHTNNELIPANK